MSFNLDISMQAQEVMLSRKAVKAFHPAVAFNDIPVACSSTPKYLGVPWMKTKPWPSYY